MWQRQGRKHTSQGMVFAHLVVHLQNRKTVRLNLYPQVLTHTHKCYMGQRSYIKTQKLCEKISTLKKSNIRTTLVAQG